MSGVCVAPYDGYLCTLDSGHGGGHVAHDVDLSTVLATWVTSRARR